MSPFGELDTNRVLSEALLKEIIPIKIRKVLSKSTFPILLHPIFRIFLHGKNLEEKLRNIQENIQQCHHSQLTLQSSFYYARTSRCESGLI